MGYVFHMKDHKGKYLFLNNNNNTNNNNKNNNNNNNKHLLAVYLEIRLCAKRYYNIIL